MTKRDRVVIARALAVLDEVAAGDRPPQSLHAVRLALHVLLPHCPEKWPLTNFYDGLQQDNEIGRGQSMNAALNGIRLQLGKRGWKPRDQS